MRFSQILGDSTNYCIDLSAWPEVRGTADTDGGAYSPSGQSSSYTLTTLSSSRSTDRRAVTDMNALRTIFTPLEAKGVLYA